jgi:cellulose biosynthesis protein BcsQ
MGQMLRPDDLINFIKSVRKLLQTEDWEPLVTVIIVAGAIGYILAWVYYRFLRRRRHSEPAEPQRPLPHANPDPAIGQLKRTIKDLETKIEDLQRRVDDLVAERDRLKEQLKADQDVLDRMLTNEGEIWRMYQANPPRTYSPPMTSSRAKIVMIANNKGGVGKTTLTAYLTTYFLMKGKRVLAIDLDYQGSLTGWMLSSGGVTIPNGQQHRLAVANRLLSADLVQNWPAEVLSGQLAGAQLITADYTLTQHETALMLRWLRQQGQPDTRYYLAQTLLSEHVQSAAHGFDIVLIDAPPRLTTGAINALVACTHLLVPTKLDPLSAETVGSFLKQVTALSVRPEES